MEQNTKTKSTNFYVVGLNYKKADAETRGKFSLSDQAKMDLLDQAKAESALLGDTTATKEVLVEQINKLQAEADVKVNALLTEDQKELFKKVVEERPAKVIPEVAPQPVKEEKKKNTEETNTTL